MAQTKPFTWYREGNPPAFPGMKANMAEDTCDSFACEGGCDPGDLVTRGTDKQWQAKKVANEGTPLGIVVHDHREPADPLFADGDSISVMTTGDIYVLAGRDVAAGDPLGYSVKNGYIKGTETTPSGNMFMSAGVTGDVVRVRIRNAAAITVGE